MFTRSLRVFAVMLLVVTALFSGSGLALAQDSGIVDTLTGLGNYVTLSSALVEKGVAETLADGEFTIFAPADSAWQALSVADRIKLYRNSQTLTDTLLHLTVEGSLSLADLTDGTVLTTLLGDTLTITHDGSNVLVNGAVISAPDVAASNGMIQGIDTFLPVAGSGMTGAEEAATEEAATEEAATEEAAAEATPEATEEAAEEAATEEAAAEATPEPTEEAAEEATPEPTEEAAEEAAAAEATPEATEEAVEEAAAPESLPETGAESSTLAFFATAVATLLALGAFAFATRRA